MNKFLLFKSFINKIILINEDKTKILCALISADCQNKNKLNINSNPKKNDCFFSKKKT